MRDDLRYCGTGLNGDHLYPDEGIELNEEIGRAYTSGIKAGDNHVR